MKLLKFCIVGDTHGDEINAELEAKFFDWLDDFRPDIRIHGGDAYNFAALRKKASPDDKATAIAPDYEAGNDFLGRYFSDGQRRVFLRGNHDERIYNLAHTTTDAASAHYAGKMVTEIGVLMRKLKATMLPYDSRVGVLDVDGIRSLHGYASGIGAARKFAQIYGTCSFNHTHSMDVAVAEKWPEPSVAYGTGCLCQIDQPYNSTQPGKLRHENGWLYGFTDGHRATYFQARCKDGAVLAANEVTAY